MAPRTPKTPGSTPDKKPAKPAKAKAAAKAKPAARPAGGKPALSVVAPGAAAAPAAKSGPLKLKDLVETVAEATGAKKPDARASVEAVLQALSAALKSGSDIVVPPLGKLRVARTSGAVMTLKLRPAGAAKAGGKGAAKPLADDGEDD